MSRKVKVSQLLNVSVPVLLAFAACAPESETDGEAHALTQNAVETGCMTGCGDGVVTAPETCDDGNTNANDGCSPACQVERCGDGIVQANEQCDDGNNVNGDACGDCCVLEAPAPACGDAHLDAGEQCDDGNTASNDGCSATCTSERCGDAVVQSNEECDDGNTLADDGCSPSCKTERCGDGTMQGNEQCDDGNTADNDGCAANCHLERCGDGIKQTGEQCDDGNTVNDDGCESDCTHTLPKGPTCDSCRAKHCRDYLGVDLVHGCFEAVNGDFGADASDPTFIQQCIDIVSCARQNHCAYSADKAAAGCYCGSNSVDACSASGPAADAPCVAQWQAGTRTTVNAEVQVRFTDLSYPAGWAYFLLECDTKSCNSAATGDCTAP